MIEIDKDDVGVVNPGVRGGQVEAVMNVRHFLHCLF